MNVSLCALSHAGTAHNLNITEGELFLYVQTEFYDKKNVLVLHFPAGLSLCHLEKHSLLCNLL